MNGLDVRGEVLAIFEVEIFLTAFFCRTRKGIALLRRIAKNRIAKLLINEYAAFLLGCALSKCLLKTLVDK
jgi:hypothetical protein